MDILDVKVHLQNDEFACGRACAQMVVHFLTNTLLAQPSFTSNLQGLQGWATTPNQLADALNRTKNHQLPAASRYVVRQGTLGTAMGYLRAAIAARRPAVAMTRAGRHWIVVRGFSEQPGKPGAPTIHVWDPAPPLTQHLKNHPPPPVPPHAVQDTCYGKNFAISGDEIVSWNNWEYQFTRCTNKPPNQWAGSYVVVVPQSVAPVPVVAPVKPAPRAGAAPLGTVAAATAVRRGLLGGGLDPIPQWRSMLSDMTTDGAKAVFVRRTDEPGDYVLVALRSSGKQGVLAAIDAASGELLFARLNPSDESLARVFTPPGDLQNVLPPGAKPTGQLLWAPTDATEFSQYVPVAEVTLQDGTTKYAQLPDGRLFDDLTPPFPPGEAGPQSSPPDGGTPGSAGTGGSGFLKLFGLVVLIGAAAVWFWSRTPGDSNGAGGPDAAETVPRSDGTRGRSAGTGGRGTAREVPPVEPLQLTNVGDVVTSAIAPDGRSFAYVRPEKGFSSLWVQQIEGGVPTRIVPIGLPIHALTFTPDSRAVDFVQQKGATWELRRVQVADSTQRFIASRVVSPPAWSPDGTRMAYIADSGDNRRYLVTAQADGTKMQSVADRRAPRRFLALTDTGQPDSRPMWLSDGLSIAVLASDDSSTDTTHIVRVLVSSGAEDVLYRFRDRPAPSLRMGLVLAPDDQSVVANVTGNRGGSVPVVRIELRTGSITDLTPGLLRYSSVTMARGRIIAVRHDRSAADVVWINPTGR